MVIELVKPEPLIPEPKLKDILDIQKEFHDRFEVPLTKEMQLVYIKLIEEEHEEWIEDYYNEAAPEYQELKELADLLYVTAGFMYQMDYNPESAVVYSTVGCYDDAITDLVEKVSLGDVVEKTLGNLIYCIFGYAKGMQWDVREAYKRVHISNMSKLGENGKPLYRQDGKVLKGPNYKVPFLEDLTNGK